MAYKIIVNINLYILIEYYRFILLKFSYFLSDNYNNKDY